MDTALSQIDAVRTGAAPRHEPTAGEDRGLFIASLREGLSLVLGLCAISLITLAAFTFRLSFSAAAFIYLVVIVLLALRAGFWEATVISLAAVGCLDYYFLPPLYSFRLDDPQGWSALAAFEFAGLVVSRLSTQVQKQLRIAGQERNRMESLYELARTSLLLDRHEPPGRQIAQSIRATVHVRSVALFDAGTNTIHSIGAPGPRLEKGVRAVWESGSDQNLPASQSWSRVLRLGNRAIGAIAIEADDMSPLVMDGIASIAAVTLERARSLEKEALAEAARQSEQLRSTVLDALAHAFKTPLTAITASSSGLLEAASLNREQTQLVQLIDDEAVRLNDLTTRLLQTARLDSAAMRLRMEVCTLSELMEKMMAPFADRLEGHPIEISMSSEAADPALSEPGEALIYGDSELLATALRQLVDNAIKYSDPGSPIRLEGRATDSKIVISVHNSGQAIRGEDLERIFERFYRSPGSEHRAPGTGLGLSITRKIAEAHRGWVSVSSGTDEGTTFCFSIPACK